MTTRPQPGIHLPGNHPPGESSPGGIISRGKHLPRESTGGISPEGIISRGNHLPGESSPGGINSRLPKTTILLRCFKGWLEKRAPNSGNKCQNHYKNHRFCASRSSPAVPEFSRGPGTLPRKWSTAGRSGPGFPTRRGPGLREFKQTPSNN